MAGDRLGIDGSIRGGKNAIHRLEGLFRQSVFGRLAGYEDVNDADRLACDPVMRQVIGGRAVDAQAASASQMGRFETETLALAANREALADLNGQWIDRFHDRIGLKYIVLDMDSSVSPTHGDQEGAAWNGHFDCTCYHPNFLFNQFGMLKRCALRNGNVRSADGWRDVLDPVITRYAERDIMRFFRADAAYAIPAIYERLEEAGYFCAIRLPANAALKDKIAHRLKPPVGRPSLTKVKRFYEDFEYQAASWDKPRRVVAKVEWHPSELFLRVGFIVTNMPMDPDWVVRFYNQRGTAEQHIKEGKHTFRWTRLSRRKFRDNEVRLQLHALAYNLATFLRCIELPEAHRKCRLESFLVRFNLIVLHNEFSQPFEAVLASDVVDYEVGLKVGEVQIGAVLRAAKALVEIRERQQFFLLEGAHQIQTLTTSPVRPTFALLPYRNTL